MCFYCLILIPIPILIQMANIIICRTVSTEPIPIPMQMATAPNLTLILATIRWNLTRASIVTLHRNDHRNQFQWSLSTYYQNGNRAVETHNKKCLQECGLFCSLDSGCPRPHDGGAVHVYSRWAAHPHGADTSYPGATDSYADRSTPATTAATET